MYLDFFPGAVRVMTIDLQIAFEKLADYMILSAGASFDLPSHTLSWIASFLSERYQRVIFFLPPAYLLGLL